MFMLRLAIIIILFVSGLSGKIFSATVSSNALSGNWTSTGSWVGGSLPGTGDTVVIVNGAVITLNTNAIIYKIKINTGGTLNIGSYTLTLQGSTTDYGKMFIQGNLNLGTGTVNLTGNWECYGTFNCGTGTVNFNGNAGQGIVGGTNATFYNLISSNTNNTTGNGLSLHATNTIVKGNMIANGVFNRNSAGNYNVKVTFAGNTQLSGTSSFYLHNIVVDTLCTLRGGSKTIYIYGNWACKGSYVCETSIIWCSYDPAHAAYPNQNIYQANPDLNPLYKLYINKSTGSVTQITGYGNTLGNLYVNNDFTVNKGSYDCGGVRRLYVKGNVLVNGTNGGIFIPNLGRLLMNGTTPQTLNMGSSDLYKFTINNAAGVTMASDVKVTFELNLSGGIINTTSAYGLWISSTDTASVLSYSSTGYVMGRLRRSVISGAQNYMFPMGPLNMGSNLYRPVYYKQTSSGGASVISMYEDQISNAGTNKANWYFKIGSDAGNPIGQVKPYYTFNTDFPSGTTECALTSMRGDISPSADWNTMLTTVVAAGSGSITSQLPAVLSPYYFIIGEVLPVINGITICSGNTASLSVSSPTGSASFNWYDAASGGNTLQTGSVTYTTPVLNSTITYYVAHQHELTGCMSHRQPVIVTVKTTPIATFTAPSPLCNNSNSTVTFTGTAGVGASYTWDFGGGNVVSGSGQGPYLISWPSSLNYSVTLQITDNSCTSSLVSHTVAVPQPISLTPAHTDAACGNSNGSASVTASGGTNTYSYSWSNGGILSSIASVPSGTYSVTVTDGNGCQQNTTVAVSNVGGPITSIMLNSDVSCHGGSNGSATVTASGIGTLTYLWANGSTTSTANNLIAGNNNVTITDGNGCTASQSVLVSEPATLVANPVSTNASCFNGSDGTASVSVTGGTPNYTYQWAVGGTSSSVTGLTQGINTVTVTDLHNCTTTASVTITQPTQLIVSIIGTDVLCFGNSNGAADFSVSGGTVGSGYQYIWSSGATTQDINAIQAGSYQVTVTDANNCMTNTGVTINQPNALVAVITPNDVLCYGASTGSANLAVSGGTTTYTFAWSNAATSQNINNIPAGIYSVIVTDAHGCTANATDTIEQPDLLQLNFATNSVLCFGSATGAVNLNVLGGSSPYNYLWSNSQTTQNISGLSAGDYSVTITDAHGCVKSDTATVLQTGDITINTIVTDVTCYGGSNGNVSVIATGGTSPYNYSWSNSSTGPSTTCPSGSYSVTVSDVNGCSNISTVTVNQPAEMIISVSSIDASCFNSNDGIAIVVTIGGTPAYDYQWSNTNTDSLITGGSGLYSVTVTDNHNCSKSTSVTIGQPSVVITQMQADSTNCFNSNDGKAHVLSSGGTAPYTFLWNTTPVQNDSVAAGLAAGIYLVTVTDYHACLKTDTVLVPEPPQMLASFTTTKTSCYGNSDGSITVAISGGHAPYSYLWDSSPVQATATAQSLPKGSYSVTITDNRSCTLTQPVELGFSDASCLEIPSAFSPNSDGNNDTWEIKYINLYPEVTVEIYNRWGSIIFKSTGYHEFWDGKYNGNEASSGTYIYIINLNNGTDPLNGTVTIIR